MIPVPWTSALNDVGCHIDANSNEFLGCLMAFVAQPSISAEDVGLEECAELERSTMATCGLDARVISTEGAPVVYGERLVGLDEPTLLFYGHYDVQPIDPVEAWTSPPFKPDIRDGRLYGRGSSDNKGQHLAQMLGIRSWLAAVGELPINVKVLLEGEEEIASPHLGAFAERNRELLAADLAVVSDGAIHDSGRTQIVFGVRGTLQLEVVVRGAATDVHSGGRGGVVTNAAWELVDLLGTLRDAAGRPAIAGFTDAVRLPSPAEQETIEHLPLDLPALLASIGATDLPPPSGPGYYERLMFLPTLSICGLSSGYDGPGFKTAIPSVARAKLDLRLVPDQDPDDVFQLVRAHIARHAPGAEVIRHGSMPPSRTPVDGPWTRPVVDAVAAVDGAPPLLVPSLGGSLPLFVFNAILGIPALVVPYANHDQRNHAPNENIELERFYRGIRITASLLAAVGAAAGRRDTS